jgi:nucleotide-binding universal stress UspA family protein
MFKRILFAHNAQPVAERAMLYLEHLARIEEADILVLHVYELPQEYASAPGYEEVVDSTRALAQGLVEDALSLLEIDETKVRGMTREGDPARVILQIAREEDVSLIVMGSRGPSSVKDLLLGEVSTEVLRNANCPVLVVP